MVSKYKKYVITEDVLWISGFVHVNYDLWLQCTWVDVNVYICHGQAMYTTFKFYQIGHVISVTHFLEIWLMNIVCECQDEAVNLCIVTCESIVSLN